MSSLGKILFFVSLICLITFSQSKVLIIRPQELINKIRDQQIHASYSNFGIFKGGFNAKGKVILPDNPDNNPNLACEQLKDIKLTPSKEDYFPIILIDKGNCSYTTMAMNVQNTGGYMALIINDKPGDVKNFPVLDDGFGNQVQIPTLLIGKAEGEIMKEYMKKYPHIEVLLDIEFTVEKREKVDIDFYLHINDDEAFFILKQFIPFYQLIAKKLNLNVYYLTQEIDGLSKTQKDDMCVSDGKYCLNLNLPKNFTVKGKNLVKDSIFHQCIFKITKEREETLNFFTFAQQYYDNCLFEVKYKEYCGRDLIENLNLNEEEVFKCMNQSFGVDSETFNESDLNRQNSLLKSNNDKLKEEGIRIIPAIDINGKRLKGTFDINNLFSMVCDSFIDKPSECFDYYYVPTSGSNQLKWYHIALIITAVIVANFIILVICRKYIIKRVDERIATENFDLDGRINSVVSSYLALRDVSKGKESSKGNNSQSPLN